MTVCKNCGRRFPDGKKVTCFCTGRSLFNVNEQSTVIEKSNNPNIAPRVYTQQDGPEVWNSLHSYKFINTEDARMFFDRWMLTVPSFGCPCKAHWAQILIDHPPDFLSAQKFFKWGVDAHNIVNMKLSKPQFSYQDALVKYNQDLRID